jgi:choline dehydrogenase-like flavoprotein
VVAQTYDAIVVGSGMTGGWAAKELTEAGLRTLVLERGGPVAHVKDYPTARLDPWELPYGNLPTQQDLPGLSDPEPALVPVRPGREALPGERTSIIPTSR